MASSMKQFLLFLFFAFSLQTIHARDGQFFSKTSRAEASPNNIPSTFENAEFPTQSYEENYKEANYPNNFANAEFQSYQENKERNYPNNFANAEFSTPTYEENRTPSSLTNEFPSETNFENKDFRNTNEFNRGSYGKQYGMSDTRFMENGKYFYDVNAEKSGRFQYDEPMKGINSNEGNMYKNQMRGFYQNNINNQESQVEYFDP